MTNARYFNPRPPRGGRLLIAVVDGAQRNIVFQSTPPARGATRYPNSFQASSNNFNPRPPRGGRLSIMSLFSTISAFQSTPPARGATKWVTVPYYTIDISIHAPREGGDFSSMCSISIHCISIHAPREGGDPPFVASSVKRKQFQSTPPARGATACPARSGGWRWQFQSTPPARGATAGASPSPARAGDFNPRPPRGGRLRLFLWKNAGKCYFNPRPPRGGRREIPFMLSGYTEISIHAPREGGDLLSAARAKRNGPFQSTPPARGATKPSEAYQSMKAISIHAPREGGDPSPRRRQRNHSPFQSTPPARGATRCVAFPDHKHSNFNPRPPRGGRLLRLLSSGSASSLISIHAPREGGD